jgi:hypothetical protein
MITAPSKLFWNIDWNDFLPLQLTNDGIFVQYSSYEKSSIFIKEHYSDIFEQNPEDPFVSENSIAKTNYFKHLGDFFEFYHIDQIVGLLLCTPTDWNTYYLRSGAVLKNYHGRKLLQRFFPILADILKIGGVERIETDTSPSNLAMMHILTKLRFNVTGNILTDRWGAHIHFTKFLNETCEKVFLDQFCSGVKYQTKEKT